MNQCTVNTFSASTLADQKFTSKQEIEQCRFSSILVADYADHTESRILELREGGF